jgi:hypothetical protein
MQQTAAAEERVKLIDRARALLYSPNAPIALALLAFLISVPSIGLGLQLDDRTYLRLFASGRSPLELLHENAPVLAHEKQLGVFAWWSSPSFTIHFLRPATALSHWLESQCWPDAAWLMHLSNCVLYALLVGVATLLYRELSAHDSRLAGLAALMFTVDEGHAQSVGWIASRHVVLATLFSLLALLSHIRGRVHRNWRLQLTSVVCTALALSSAEYGVAALAYIAAYACVFEPGPLPARLKSVWPHALVGASWISIYVALGCGVRDASWYRDPITAPVDTLLQGLADLPLWLVSQLGGDVASAAVVLQPSVARTLAFLLLVPLLALLLPPLAASKPARFFAIGMLLSCLLLFATVPQDRLLLAASFGGFGWLACFMCGVGEHTSAIVRSSAIALRIPHLLFAPLGFIPMLGGVAALDGAAQALASEAAQPGSSQAIVVNLPAELLTNAAWSIRNAPNVPLHQLYAGFSKLTATRPDDHTLEIVAEDSWGTRPLERMFTTRRDLPGLGEVRAVEGMRATVLGVDPDGLPHHVRFEFPNALESQGRVWLVWEGRRPIRWRPPAIGAQIEVPSASMLTLVY